MIINHNMNALNAHRNMVGNTATAGKSMEKLSSGLRINRAGDDAAGLAISEKMRGQIRGLDQASRNAQDGISLIQTAEGALNETHNILQRMRELSVQSANDTNVAKDREAIQAEVNQLTKEIDRISSTTEFNTQKLLDGSFDGQFQIGANASQSIELNIGKMDAASLGLTATVKISETVPLTALSNFADGTYTVKSGKLYDAQGVEVKGATVGTQDFTVNGKQTKFVNSLTSEGATLKIENGYASVTNKLDTATAAKNLDKLAPGNYEVVGTNLVKDGVLVGTVGSNLITLPTGDTIASADLGFVAAKLVAGAKFTVNGSDVSNRTAAEGSITTIDKAIETVSTQRSQLGAVQNRLEHTTANLQNTSENLTAAESRVRDVDMAKEMMNFTKNNILSQAAQAMLAQANQQPQGVLQLLR